MDQEEVSSQKVNKLKVLHSTPIWLPQTMTWLYNQVLNLSEAQVESHVVCQKTMLLDQFKVKNIHCWPGDSWGRKKLSRLLRLVGVVPEVRYATRVAKLEKAQILHSHFGYQGWAMLDVASAADLRHVVTFYGYDVNRLPKIEPVWRERYRRLFADAILFLCEGPHMASDLVSLGCPPEKIEIQRLGVDLSKLPFRKRRRKVGAPLRILIAGTFREKKGVKYALEAVGALINKGVDVELTLVGDATDESDSISEKKHINEVISRFDMERRVKKLGFMPHDKLIEQFYSHDVFLSPSVTAVDGDTEGGAPVSIIEAAASGMPVVATVHCDIPFVLGGDRGGWFAPERDVVTLSKLLEEVVNNPLSVEAKVCHARSNIEVNHDQVVQGRRLAEIYNAVLKKGSIKGMGDL